jgi:ParB family chromosome partitioning protein
MAHNGVMRRGIGKGLAQLLGDTNPPHTPTRKDRAPAKAAVRTSTAESAPAPKSSTGTSLIALNKIVANKRQPRSRFDDQPLSDLADSIRELGVIQPVIVRPVGDDRYELIAGERRFRASQLAGLKDIPAVVRTVDAHASLEMALVENIQREDISAIECARAYKLLVDEFGMTQESVADRVGKSRSAVANTMRLLRLPDEIQAALESGDVSEGQVRPLLSLDPRQQVEVFRRIVGQGLNARQVEALVKFMLDPSKPEEVVTKPVDPNWMALQSGLTTFLGAKTSLKRGKVGGQLVVDFYSDDDLQRILDQLGFRI